MINAGFVSSCQRTGGHLEALAHGLLPGQRAVGFFFVIGRVIAQACIGDARQLVGQRAAGLVVIAPVLHGQRPGAQAVHGLARVARRGGPARSTLRAPCVSSMRR